MKLVRVKDGYRKVGDKYLLARKCSTCGRWLVASTDNFSRHKTSKYGLSSECKKCASNRNKQWQEANRDKRLEYYKQYHEANRDKRNKYNKQYHEANREKELEYKKQYYEANRDKILEHSKQYYQTPQGQAVRFNNNQRRRAKEQQLGTGITKDQWLEMMQYFDWKCAYSGEYLGGSNNSFNRTIDHIMPINSNGDNMVWNMVPMLRSLNCSKCAKDMLEWYKEQSFYSEDRLAKIYEWQEHAYNKWGKDSEYFNTNDIQIKLI